MADTQRIQQFLADYKAGGGSFNEAMSFLSSQGLVDDESQLAPVMQQRQELKDSGAPVAFTNPVGPTEPITLEQASSGNYRPADLGVGVGPHYSLGEAGSVGAIEDFVGIAEGTGQAAAEMNPLISQVPFVGQVASLAKGLLHSATRQVSEGAPAWRRELNQLAEESEVDYLRFGEGTDLGRKAKLLGTRAALDPLNALPGVGFADDIMKIGSKLGAAGAKSMAKGILTDDQWARAFATGLTEEAVETTNKLGGQLSVALKKRDAVYHAADVGAKASARASDDANYAAGVAHDAYTGKIARLTAEYNDALENLHKTFPAQPEPSTVRAVPEDPASFLDLGPTRADDIGPADYFLSTRTGTPPRVATETIPGRTPAMGSNRRLAEEVLTKGYHRQLAQANMEYNALAEFIEKAGVKKLQDAGTTQEWLDRAVTHVAKKSDEFWDDYAKNGAGATDRHARDAIARVSREAAASSTAPADEVAETLGHIAREKGRAYMMSDSGVPAAALRDKPGLFEKIATRSIGVFKGGEEGAVGEGLLRIAADRYEDPAIRKSVKSWARMIEQSGGDVAETTFRAQELRRQVSREVSRFAKENGLSVKEAGERLMLNEARRGADLSVIPDTGVQQAVADAGAFIDELTERFVQEGLVHGNAAEVLRHNLGKYLHTSYAFTHSKNWADQVQNTQVWDKAFDWMKGAYPDMTDAQIEGQMLWMVERQQGVTFGKGKAPFTDILPHGNIPTQQLDELKHKKDLPPELQELFGINKDFFVDFDTTAVKMIGDLEATAVQRRILANGLRNGTLRTSREAVPGSGAGHTVAVTLDRISPDRRFYATEETAAALGIFNEKLKEHGAIQAMMFFNGLTKFGKIVPSPSTQARNAWSLGPMLMMNGTASSSLVRPMVAKEAARLASKVWKIKVIRNKSATKLTKAEEELVLQAHKHNLFGTGVFTGEQEIWAKQVGDVMTGSKVARTEAFKKGETAMDAMRRSYTSTDDFGKFYSWMVTKEKFAGLYDTANPADLKFLQDTYGTTDLDAAAAEYVKQTFQHFPRTAPIGKKLARFPVAGTFVSFPLEMTRNLKNTVLISAQEARHFAQTGNPKHLVSSMEKIAGISAVGYMFKGAKDWSAAKFDVDTEAFNDLGLGSWAKGTDYAVTDRQGSKISYADAGFVNPYKDINRIIETGLLSEGPISERLFRVAEQVEEVLLGREIFLNAAVTALTNQSPEGGLLTGALKPKARRIANPEDPNQLADRAYYFLKQVAPGGMVSAERVATSLGAGRGFGLAPGNKKGRDLNTASEVMGLFGMPRTTTVDISENLGYRMWDLRDDFDNIRAARNSNMRMESDPAGRAEVDEIYQEKWSDLEDQYISAVENAKKLGVSRRDIIKSLDSLHVKKAVKNRIINGVKSDVRFALGPPKLYEEQ